MAAFNQDKLNLALAGYVKNFHEKKEYTKGKLSTWWWNESFKWVAVKHFQDHWNIDAPDFAAMFKEATAKTYNLLSSLNYLPRGMILEFAKVAPEDVKNMFRELFNEKKSVVDRVKKFIEESNRILTTYGGGKRNSHYQNVNSISTYLWLRYPEKYYIFKYSECKNVAAYLESSYKVKKGAKPEALLDFISFYDSLNSAIHENREVVELVRNALTPLCDNDEHGNTLTVDVGFYISRLFTGKGVEDPESEGEKQPEQQTEDHIPQISYWPTEDLYPVHITKEQWKKYIQDVEFSHRGCMGMLKALLELGGEATCKKLSDVYGAAVSCYVGCAVNIGRRAKKYFDLPPFVYNDRERFYVIPFYGRAVVIDGKTYYSYKLRPELFDALKETDLTSIDPYMAKSMEEETGIAKYTKSDFLNDVYMDESRYDSLVSLLKYKKNIILQGAPGVGKTFAAKRLAWSVMGETDSSRIEMIQFHQNYSYEDFIMGYKPTDDGFELRNGVFYNFCQTAAEDPEKNYFFIIDEINRGNLSKIFGELLMLIEKDYRCESLTLPYTGQPFSIPENLYLIGMMNTADRSLAMIDYALRRRFSFFTMSPGFGTVGFKAYQQRLNSSVFDHAISAILQLNQKIENEKSLGKGFCIGHSYFCNAPEDDVNGWVRSVIEYDIIPLIQEYWFDNEAEADSRINELRDAVNG